jgi:hypothetical protein
MVLYQTQQKAEGNNEQASLPETAIPFLIVYDKTLEKGGFRLICLSLVERG